MPFDEQQERVIDERKKTGGRREKYSRPAGSSSGLNAVGKQLDQFSRQRADRNFYSCEYFHYQTVDFFFTTYSISP